MKISILERKRLSWFFGSFIRVEMEFGDVGFCEGKKTGEPGEKPQGKLKTNTKLRQSTSGTGPTTNPYQSGGRSVFSLICQPCSPGKETRKQQNKIKRKKIVYDWGTLRRFTSDEFKM